jgi:ketosteroid isomerase-like protein
LSPWFRNPRLAARILPSPSDLAPAVGACFHAGAAAARAAKEESCPRVPDGERNGTLEAPALDLSWPLRGPGSTTREHMPGKDRLQTVRDCYGAFAAGDRDFFEEQLTDDFTFSAPPDPKLDRDGYFERCWPGSGRDQEFEFVRLIESGDEVVVTYESTKPDGSRFRNTEVLTFDREKISNVEVYFGWDLQ